VLLPQLRHIHSERGGRHTIAIAGEAEGVFAAEEVDSGGSAVVSLRTCRRLRTC
jgi:hypothetical protein